MTLAQAIEIVARDLRESFIVGAHWTDRDAVEHAWMDLTEAQVYFLFQDSPTLLDAYLTVLAASVGELSQEWEKS